MPLVDLAQALGCYHQVGIAAVLMGTELAAGTVAVEEHTLALRVRAGMLLDQVPGIVAQERLQLVVADIALVVAQ